MEFQGQVPDCSEMIIPANSAHVSGRNVFKVFAADLQTSLYEVARLDDFSSMNLILEDFMRDNGAHYSGMMSSI